MTDTPRVDAKEDYRGINIKTVTADFARELEREINQLKMERDRYREALEFIKQDCEICEWECRMCNCDPEMKQTDLYHAACKALHPQPEQGK